MKKHIVRDKLLDTLAHDPDPAARKFALDVLKSGEIPSLEAELKASMKAWKAFGVAAAKLARAKK